LADKIAGPAIILESDTVPSVEKTRYTFQISCDQERWRYLSHDGRVRGESKFIVHHFDGVRHETRDDNGISAIGPCSHDTDDLSRFDGGAAFDSETWEGLDRKGRVALGATDNETRCKGEDRVEIQRSIES
jgi:hypothetical protein